MGIEKRFTACMSSVKWALNKIPKYYPQQYLPMFIIIKGHFVRYTNLKKNMEKDFKLVWKLKFCVKITGMVQ